MEDDSDRSSVTSEEDLDEHTSLRAIVRDEVDKAFRSALPDFLASIREQIQVTLRQEFAALRESLQETRRKAVMEVEAERGEASETKPKSKKRKIVHQSSGPVREEVPTCSSCGRKHYGGCRFGTKACYTCGELGHFSKDCRSYQQLCYNCYQPGHFKNRCPRLGVVIRASTPKDVRDPEEHDTAG